MIGGEFDRPFDLIAILIGGIGEDLSMVAHWRVIVFPKGVDRSTFDSLCERDLEEVRLARRFFRQHQLQHVDLDLQHNVFGGDPIKPPNPSPCNANDAPAEFL